MKNNTKPILLMSLPLVFVIILGFIFLLNNVYDGPTKTISGEITLFNEGSNRRYGSTPMHIEIDNDTYIITGGVRWSTDLDDLKETLSLGNTVTIEFYEEVNMKYVVGIKYKDITLVTKDEYIEGQYKQNKLKSTIAFYIAYTYLLIEIMVLLSFSKKFNFDFNLGYLNKVTLYKWKHILNIFISILLIIGSFAVTFINKWLYLPAVTISLAYLFYTFILKDRLYFGKGRFIIFTSGKIKHYGWNAIQEIIKVSYKNKMVVVLNFKEKYDLKDNNIKEYLFLAKKRKNKFVYILNLSKDKLKEFNKLEKKYYITKHN